MDFIKAQAFQIDTRVTPEEIANHCLEDPAFARALLGNLAPKAATFAVVMGERRNDTEARRYVLRFLDELADAMRTAIGDGVRPC